MVVRLADAPVQNDGAVTGDSGAGPARVIYSDLQKVANELWAAGAEAIAINGQRLTATSTIRSAGEAILVDFRPVTSPYEVVGDRAEVVAGPVRRQPVGVSDASGWPGDTGLSFEVRRADDLTLPAAPEPRLRYARPSVSPNPSPAGSGAVRPSGTGSSGPGPSSSPSGGGR